jgi:UDP-GlcNAc:undecaprenyl-phosphate/decaprenyl-phosphate GlcNAc-1-phosphate transferase
MESASRVLPFLTTFLGAAIVSLVVGAMVRRLAPRFGHIVLPRPDRWHRTPTPTLGGIGIFLGLLAGALIAGAITHESGPVLASASALFLIGWSDDRDPLSALAKMVASLAIAAFFVMTLTGFVATPLQASLAVLAIIVFGGLGNAFNLLDNMDGLAASVSAIAALGLAATFRAELGPALVSVLVGLSGALAGFLWWNRHPARLFMGNCGSLTVGGVIAACATLAVVRAGTLDAVAAAVLIVIVPIFDCTFVVLLRRLAGRSTTTGNVDHTSHRLVGAGFSEPAAVLSLAALGLIGAGVGYALRHAGGSAWLIAAIFAVGVVLIALALARVPAYGGQDFRALQTAPFAPLLNDLTFRWHAGEVLLDLVLITICYYAAYRVRFAGDALANFLTSFSASLPLIVGCQLAALYVSGLYARMWSTFGLEDLWTVVRAVGMGAVLSVLSITYLYKFERYSRSVFLIDAALLLAAILATRSSLRVFTRLAARTNPSRRRVAIYGAGTRGQLLAREFLATESWSRKPVVFVDDDAWKQGRRIVGVPVRGGLDQLGRIVRDFQVDEVVISSPAIDQAAEARVRAICQAPAARVCRLSLDIS